MERGYDDFKCNFLEWCSLCCFVASSSHEDGLEGMLYKEKYTQSKIWIYITDYNSKERKLSQAVHSRKTARMALRTIKQWQNKIKTSKDYVQAVLASFDRICHTHC